MPLSIPIRFIGMPRTGGSRVDAPRCAYEVCRAAQATTFPSGEAALRQAMEYQIPPHHLEIVPLTQAIENEF